MRSGADIVQILDLMQ